MKRGTKAHRLNQQRLRDLGHVMSSVEGRRFVNQLLLDSHIMDCTFSPDPYINAHNMGTQNFGKRILADLMAAYPDAYLTMVKESQIEEEISHERRADEHRDGDE